MSNPLTQLAVGRSDMARTVLVTGGNRGIGLAIARAFAAQGDRVAVTHRGSERARRAVRRRVRRHRRRLGRRRVHRGRGRAGPGRGAGRQRRHHRRHAAAADDRGAVHRRRRHQPHRRLPGRQARLRQDAARPVRPDDLHLLGGRPVRQRRARSTTRASKAGLVGIARSITRELGTRNITANVVAPGFVDTDMTAEPPRGPKAEILESIPAGRFAPPGGGRRGGHVPGQRPGRHTSRAP